MKDIRRKAENSTLVTKLDGVTTILNSIVEFTGTDVILNIITDTEDSNATITDTYRFHFDEELDVLCSMKDNDNRRADYIFRVYNEDSKPDLVILRHTDTSAFHKIDVRYFNESNISMVQLFRVLECIDDKLPIDPDVNLHDKFRLVRSDYR